jgi:hypothetical protein
VRERGGTGDEVRQSFVHAEPDLLGDLPHGLPRPFPLPVGRRPRVRGSLGPQRPRPCAGDQRVGELIDRYITQPPIPATGLKELTNREREAVALVAQACPTTGSPRAW